MGAERVLMSSSLKHRPRIDSPDMKQMKWRASVIPFHLLVGLSQL